MAESALSLDLISHTAEKNSDETYCTVAGENDVGYGNSNELEKRDYSFRRRVIQ